jgi:choline-sulfatase
MTGRHASEIGAWDNGALLPADQPTFAHYMDEAGYDAVLSGKMHFIGPDQLHGFRRRFSTDIYSSDFNWVKPEWISVKESRGKNLDEAMSNRQSYNASGYIGEAVRINVWHNALSHDEETHFRAVEYLRDPDGLRRLRRAYYGLVTYTDRLVGGLLQTLEGHRPGRQHRRRILQRPRGYAV